LFIAIAGLAILLIFWLGHLTWKQIPIYKNDSALWSDTVQKNPNAWMAHYNLGNILIAQQKHEEAIAHYQQTIRIKPDFVNAYNNFWIALLKQGKIEESIIQFRKAIK
jgi:tetratricopeptide (TPR) repeat protein